MTPDWDAIQLAERADYIARNGTSQKLFEAATRLEPGGNSRATVFHDPFPVTFVRGQGSAITDADGNTRVDFVNNFTSLALGHSDPEVVDAIAAAAADGTAFAGPNPREYELAQVIADRVGGADLVRFCTTGTEATAVAIRLARAFTGRDVVMKFSGAYHGSHDYSMSPGPGVPASVSKTVIEGRLNDIAAVERVVDAMGQQLAAVIVEPVQGTGGMLPMTHEFAAALRRVCDGIGAVLIFDEVMSLRLAHGGMQQVLQVRPDLTTMGKIIGGGLPLSAVAGRAELVGQLDPRRDIVRLSGTFNANPLACAAGLVTMKRLSAATIAEMNKLGEYTREQLRTAFESAGVAGTATGYGSLLNIHLVADPVDADPELLGQASKWRKTLALALMNKGFVIAPRGLICMATTTTKAQVDDLAECVYSLLSAGQGRRDRAVTAIAAGR